MTGRGYDITANRFFACRRTIFVRVDSGTSFVCILAEVIAIVLSCSLIVTFAISCAAPTTQLATSEPPMVRPAGLGRFMRESVNVPFSFVMIETATARRERRVHRAASMLHDAARDLVDWSDPPVESDEGRAVFYAYAEHLEYNVGRLEHAAARREVELAVESVEDIRQTCNDCHRFFRPASAISPDVAYDWDALELGGFR